VRDPASGNGEPAVPVQGKRLLVVDDEPDVAAVLGEMLAVDRHAVDTAADGAEALARVRTGGYDAIFSDMKMPGIDGPGLYRELERTDPQLSSRVIFLTGDTLGSEIRQFLETSRAPTVEKPFALDEIRRAVGRVLRAEERA
jgi:CheY-like chemotaxis protein